MTKNHGEIFFAKRKPMRKWKKMAIAMRIAQIIEMRTKANNIESKPFYDKPPYSWQEIEVFISTIASKFNIHREYLYYYTMPTLQLWCRKWKLFLADKYYFCPNKNSWNATLTQKIWRHFGGDYDPFSEKEKDSFINNSLPFQIKIKNEILTNTNTLFGHFIQNLENVYGSELVKKLLSLLTLNKEICAQQVDEYEETNCHRLILSHFKNYIIEVSNDQWKITSQRFKNLLLDFAKNK